MAFQKMIAHKDKVHITVKFLINDCNLERPSQRMNLY